MKYFEVENDLFIIVVDSLNKFFIYNFEKERTIIKKIIHLDEYLDLNNQKDSINYNLICTSYEKYIFLIKDI